MAPELFKKQPYSPIKTDAWAMGVLIYYLMEGKIILIQANILTEVTTKKTSFETSAKIS